MAKQLVNIHNNSIEIEHLTRIENYSNLIDDVYASAVAEFAKLAKSIPGYNPDKFFSFSDYPETKRMVERILKAIHSRVYAIIEKGIDAEWLESAGKNDITIDALIKSSGLLGNDATAYREKLSQYYDRNLDALKAFKDRKTDGLNLSDRVWKHTDNLLPEVEMIMDRGLAEGKSAAALSRETRKYLNEPNRIFRRVRNDKGELVLSKAAKSYHPGQGVYRSSSKNAKRLTRDIINESYRESDWQRYQQLDFVVGFQINLSTNPYHCPTCVALAGKYPKSFKWTKWHVQCRCFITSIMSTEDERREIFRNKLRGLEIDTTSVNAVKEMPANFTQFMTNNEDRFARAKKQPYWVRDNFKGGDPRKGLNILITNS